MGKLGGVYAASRVMGLARELAVAYTLGTSAAADRVTAAFLIASAAGLVLGEAVFAGAVSRIGEAEGRLERVRRYAAVFRAAARIAFLACVAYVAVGSVATVALLGAWQEDFGDTVLLAVLLAPSVGAYVMSASVNGWLTVEGRFLVINAVQVLYSVGTLCLLLVAGSAGLDLEAQAIVAGWSLGNIAALAVLLRVARPERVRSGNGELRLLLKLGAPLAIGSALLVAQSVSGRAVAARLDTGDVAALGYADRLFLLPLGFVLAVVGPIVLGSLTVAASGKAKDALGRILLDHLGLISKLAVPVSLVFAALAPLAVPLIFQYGAFSDASTERTVEAVDGLAAGLAAVAMVLVLVRVLQATRQHSKLIHLTGAAAAVNLVLGIVGGVLLGLEGVALATSLTAALTVMIGIEVVGIPFGAHWLAAGRRLATAPIVASTAALGFLLIGQELGLLTQTARLAVIGALALTSIGALGSSHRAMGDARRA